MLIFPTLVYQCPGIHQCAGGTYGYRQVKNPKELADAFDAGWFATLPEAIDGKHAQAESLAPDESAPTREELERKAGELGIKFDGRTGDKRLTALIEEQLKG